MEQMLAQRLRASGKKVPAKPKQQPAVVSTTLKVDFPINAATAEEYLIATHQLQEKIKAADLGGLKELAKLSPQEEELAEELEGMQQEFGGNEPKRGEPLFLFVCKISDAERAKALAEAFQKARTEGARLAKAAGVELGALQTLANQTQPGDGLEDPNTLARRYYAMMQQGRQGQIVNSDDTTGEAVGTQPGKVTLRITVSASFRLKAPAAK
jgi:hypothetical protein